MNIQAAPVEESALQPQVTSVPTSADAAASDQITDLDQACEEVLKLLKGSKRPLLWLGHGIRLAGAAEKVAPLLERLRVPALVSWQAIDVVDSDHRYVYGRAGIYGQRAANFVLQNCDALICIGTRIAVPQMGYEMSEFVRTAKVACVDIDPLELQKHGEKIALKICADAGDFLNAFERALDKDSGASSAQGAFERPDWLKHCDTLREKYPFVGPEHADKDGFINSYPFMAKLERSFHKNQVVVTDMGTALLSGHQVLRMKKGQRLMTSTGLGEMGYGLPAAIGASFGLGEHEAPGNSKPGQVICLNCDGGMMMNLQELQTIVHHQLPIKIIIFNNDGYLMIKHTQKALFQGRYTGTDRKSGVTCPDYSKLAKAFEIPSYQIRTWEDMDRVIPEVQAHAGPVICEVFMHPEQLFVPKLSLAPQKDGSIVSPPLEDLSPLIPREDLRKNMIIGLHPKSESL